VQPPRGRRTNAVLRFFWAAFATAAVLNLPGAIFDLTYPNWLLWTVRVVVAIWVLALVVFMAMRAGEVVGGGDR